MKTLPFILIFLSAFSVACSKKTTDNANNVTPANLMISAIVSTDSSGNVAFTASATNAVHYDYDFGNYVFQANTPGNISYKYLFSGTYTVTVTAKSTGGQTVSKSITVIVSVAQTLVWSDEFNTPGSPDPAKWGYDLGTGNGGWGNNELEYYTNRQANAVVSNGTLKIIAVKELYNGSAYTSARMLSNKLYSFKYGKIEVRAKVPAAAGTWPAIWMLGNDIATAGWPACGEIDIMEQNGSQKSTIYGTLHYPLQLNPYGDGATKTIPTPSSAFHRYTAIWSPNSIQLLIDDEIFYTLLNTPSIPFNQEFFIILNLAMGGNFGGSVDPAFTSDQMEVDYVRVYQ